MNQSANPFNELQRVHDYVAAQIAEKDREVIEINAELAILCDMKGRLASALAACDVTRRIVG